MFCLVGGMKEWQCVAYPPVGVILPHFFLAPICPKLMTQSLMFYVLSGKCNRNLQRTEMWGHFFYFSHCWHFYILFFSHRKSVGIKELSGLTGAWGSTGQCALWFLYFSEEKKVCWDQVQCIWVHIQRQEKLLATWDDRKISDQLAGALSWKISKNETEHRILVSPTSQNFLCFQDTRLGRSVKNRNEKQIMVFCWKANVSPVEG